MQFRHQSEPCIVESTFHIGSRPLLLAMQCGDSAKEIEPSEISSDSDIY
jgi:hypothetical protein